MPPLPRRRCCRHSRLPLPGLAPLLPSQQTAPARSNMFGSGPQGTESYEGSKGDVVFKTWAFCPVTGSLLILDAAKGVARSEKCHFERPLEELDDTMEVGGWDC